jgi:hypothetical protein
MTATCAAANPVRASLTMQGAVVSAGSNSVFTSGGTYRNRCTARFSHIPRSRLDSRVGRVIMYKCQSTIHTVKMCEVQLRPRQVRPL